MALLKRLIGMIILTIYVIGSAFTLGCSLNSQPLTETLLITVAWPIIVPLYLLYVLVMEMSRK